MQKLYDIDSPQERFVLVGVAVDDSDDTNESIEELKELVYTAGAQSVGEIIQNRERIHSATYIGKGKIEEVRDLVLETDA
ncbi:MAG: GTPase HflX, partial [Clostridiales bacterium]|nr:GTPase HflX [Clostridiales bacterium]